MKKAKQIGINAYIAEQNEKIDILSVLLRDYNDGRRKTFFCLAVNLLELEDIKAVMENIKKDTDTKAVVLLFEETAERRGVSLKRENEQRGVSELRMITGWIISFGIIELFSVFFTMRSARGD
jgi:hypothetical protein